MSAPVVSPVVEVPERPAAGPAASPVVSAE